MAPGLSNMETLKKNMFKDAMKRSWENVLKTYQDYPEVQKQRITRSQDTALHVAVFDGKVEIVTQLLNIIELNNLYIKNGRGNTALHLAASLGMVDMCKCIAAKDPNLIGARNNNSETPLFLAALHGHKDVFLCLHSHLNVGDYSFCRRNDGDTILHVAIMGEYFDLAYQIIQLYEELVTYVNERGLSPLHILAAKPSAFKSGSRLGQFDLIIYNCIFVDQLKTELTSRDPNLENSGEGNSSLCPKNGGTCLNFFNLLKTIFLLLVGKHNTSGQRPDMENPGGTLEDRSLSHKQSKKKDQKPNQQQLLPPNYITCFDFFKLVMKALLVFLGKGLSRIRKIREKKEKHTWALRIMEELVERTSDWEYDGGRDPKMSPLHVDDETYLGPLPDNYSEISEQTTERDPDKKEEGKSETPMLITAKTAVAEMTEKILEKFPVGIQEMAVDDKQPNTDIWKETPILVAAKMGVTEMIEKILDKFPVAIEDMNSDGKNVVLLAVENRQPHVYQLLLKEKILQESVFHTVDNDGNSALHIAATLGQYRPWLIPGAALQMQWEIKWYKFVKKSMPRNFFARYNKKNKTPKEVFIDTHKGLVNDGGKWLTNTSESCSVVAALIATVAFATAASVPGGLDQNTGKPLLEKEPAFNVFAISSLVALCFSVTAVIMFLSVLTSRHQEKDFRNDLPNKLILGLTSLFISITSMLVSFCAGQFFVLKDELRNVTYPLYAVTCFPITIFAVAQFPLYVDLVRATFRDVPQRSYKVIPT